MKLLVDTSVWVDFFRKIPSPPVIKLKEAVKASYNIHICGVILAEILQGTRSAAQYKKLEKTTESFTYVETYRHTYAEAAEIYQTLQRKGYTARKTIDCIIAATAIEHKLALLHNDRDFIPIAKYCGLITA